jgi:hypothetical protein
MLRAVEDPVIRLIHPAICPVGGGTTLRLTGNHFCNQSAVRIGGKDAPVLHFSDLAQGIHPPPLRACGRRRQQQQVKVATDVWRVVVVMVAGWLAGWWFGAGESQSQQLEVRSPRLAKVGFHAVEVVNPGGKRYRLDDVLYYTDDPALLGDDHTSPAAADKPAKAKEPSSAARRVSGFFGRASVSASSSPTLSKDNLRGATMRRAESTDNLEAARLGTSTNGIAAAAASRLGVLPTASPVHLRNTSDSLGGGGGYTRGNRNGDGDEESAGGGQAWASRSASILTKSPRQQMNPAPPSPAVAFGAMTIGDLIDDGSGSNAGRGGRVSGRPSVGSGHARSVSLDQSAIARGVGGGRGVAAAPAPATTFLSSGGSGVGRGLGASSSSGGIFWNVIDDDPSSVSAPSSPSLSSSSSSSSAHVPTSRLRWGATNKNNH